MDDLMTRAQRYGDRARTLTYMAKSEKNRALRASLVKAAKDYIHLCEKLMAKNADEKRSPNFKLMRHYRGICHCILDVLH
jgi:hypothetical protein